MLNRLLGAVVALVIAAPFSGANAAPQALGLVATNAPVPLKCFAGECAAEFTAFCLQQARPIPDPGTAFRPVGDSLALFAIAADGRTQRLPGAEYLTIVSARGFTAVRIAMTKRSLEALGAVRVAVEVGRGVTLVPVAVAGDPDPLSDLEIANATGPLRAAGDRIVDNGGADADATRLTVSMVNALPEYDRVSVELGERLWQRTIGDATGEAVARANAVYKDCRQAVDEGFNFSLRACFEKGHDWLILDLNTRYWRAMVGS